MKKILLLSVVLIFQTFLLAGQDSYRFSYLQLRKNDPSAEKYFADNMTLDFDGRTSFYYDDISLKKDSLSVLAFSKSGEIADQKAYRESTRLPGSRTNDRAVIDFSKGQMFLYYFEVAFFDGKMPLVLPQWKTTGEEEEQSGYRCKIAKGNYLGREWTIWFTDEIPVNVGPWLLWGAPGLIVYAKDSENLFSFRLLGVEKIPASRLQEALAYRKNRESSPWSKVFSYSMKEMETMHTKYRRDVEYFNKIHGIVGGYMEDRNGSRIEEHKTLPYIPLISEEYWNGR